LELLENVTDVWFMKQCRLSFVMLIHMTAERCR